MDKKRLFGEEAPAAAAHQRGLLPQSCAPTEVSDGQPSRCCCVAPNRFMVSLCQTDSEEAGATSWRQMGKEAGTGTVVAMATGVYPFAATGPGALIVAALIIVALVLVVAAVRRSLA
ncbi:hypothetical protein E2562_031183 [Oryza meyeriana var. granulata]|uniref:Uncharacterized protein n=1 Tax=Oryza meyeriana var. granulata TaxID=110450 RepID=A0A6G1ERI3_9ORYZ|nr:hypothetical protein E2562_031183 [Oryza meyeriana var. granulata]